MSKALTPKMNDAIDKIRKNGNRVGYGLNNLRKIGVNGNVAHALLKRGIVYTESSEGILWLVLKDEYRMHHFRATHGRDVNAGTDKPQNFVWLCGDCDQTREQGPHFFVR